jgi:non-specific serine/threonine protein kinase
VEIMRRIGEPRPIGISLAGLAWWLLPDGRYDEARAALDEARSYLNPDRDQAALASVQHTAGTLAVLCGDLDRAAACYGAALRETVVDGDNLPYNLAGLALVAARRGEPERTLRLLGAAAKALGGGQTTESWWQRLLADAEQSARAQIGAARAVAATVAGGALTAEEAIEYAIHDHWPGTSEDGTGPELTRRERQVAGLVAQGFTDRQIGVRLGLSPRTVASHLSHIRTKLDLPTRTQVTVWATRPSRT